MKRVPLIVLALVAVLWLAAAERLAVAGTPPAMRRIAVVVGANDPPPRRQALRFAHDDAKDLADVLMRVGGFSPADVTVLLDPHPREILATLDRVAKTAAGAGGDVLFVFYYSGHSDGQSLFPHGEAISLADLRARVEHLGARIRVGILDTCRGGSWTQSKGLTVGPPLQMADLLNVETEGTALVSSSSGIENAHEAVDVHGSFFTHYLTAGLRGAADRAGDGNVTLEEAFDYAKERTVRDSARLAKTPQHPSFDLALRGRQDIVLTVLSASTSSLEVTGDHPPLEIIHLPSGVTVADAPHGKAPLRVALPPGRYLVRSVSDGHVYAKEVEVHGGETATLAEGQLEATGNDQLAMKGDGEAVAHQHDDDDESDDGQGEESPSTPRGPTVTVYASGPRHDADEDHDTRILKCNDPEPEGKVRVSTGCEGVLGVRGSIVGISGGAQSTQLTGLEFSIDSEEYWHKHLYSGVWQERAAIGGGGAGLEGALFGNAGIGFRIPVEAEQGPVVRAAAEGYLFGNNAFYSSLIELPQLQLGWQWSTGHAVAEIAGTAGVVLTGRFRAGDAATREMGTGGAYGGHLSVQVPWIRVSAMFERLPSEDGLAPVDMGMATLCAVASPVAICADGLVEQSNALVAGGDPFVRAAYGGITLGFTGEH
jgi:hypothetical protein